MEADTYTPYERGLATLLERIGRDTPARTDLLVFQQRLTENIREARLHGDTEQRRADRTTIIAGLNVLARVEVGVDFNSLCGLSGAGGDQRKLLPSQRDRATLLKRVEKRTVSLKQSPPKELQIPLSLTEQPNALDLPMVDFAQETRPSSRDLPAGTRIIDVFEQNQGAFLILGEPGTGKTTLLVELALDLTARAKLDETQPIPIVFLLASWTEEQRLLKDWLVKELISLYDVPFNQAQAWIDDKAILPLLDGLDEVASSQQNACAEAIKAYRQEHGLEGLIVSSRVKDYEALSTKLKLEGAILIQQLRKEQVKTYLAQTGKTSKGLRTALKDDPMLWELMDTPLMLTIARLAYEKNLPTKPQVSETLEERRRRLFDDYIKAMFERRSKPIDYTQQQTTYWLSWLAVKMMRHNLTEFYIEEMQPDWLPLQQYRRYVLRVRLLSALVVVGPGIGLCLGLIGLGAGLGVGLGVGLVFELFYGIGFLLSSRLGSNYENIYWLKRARVSSSRSTATPNRRIYHHRSALSLLVSILGYCLVCGLIGGPYGLGVGLRNGLHYGGRAGLQHYTLRWLLYRNGSLPLHLVPFLDFCAERIFLRKVGDGYSFIHRLLMEHFASLYTEQDAAEPGKR